MAADLRIQVSLQVMVFFADYRDGVKTPTKVCYPILPRELCPARSYSFLIGSCNGLVCFALRWDQILVWNTFTSSYRKLPDISRGRTYIYGFGYDSASDDYKVLFIGTGPDHDPKPGDGARVHIFSLKTGSWKKVENPDDTYLQFIQRWRKGLFLNQLLHWQSGCGLLSNGALHWQSGGDGSLAAEKIFAFDLSKEKFYDVPSPISGYRYQNHHSMGVVGEYFCMCFSDFHEGTNSVWVMKEYCNEASWVHFISYSSFQSDNACNFVDYVCDLVPQSVKDARYMILQFFGGYVDILKWNNSLEESDRGEKYHKNIKFYRHIGVATSYTEALTSPYACTEIDRRV
ncbi:hypothetical protein Tsubulata_044358 [Turnera subulata]|uniref:F-box associated beta-propeller type 3 domain-containing protein n=1 Tax=Turnera subulata TaxID=218843 RepID=A0A9Q0F8P3_9ROSI|nr:hypothetical protein Tsubulata_044358 [Turnera subulata]